MEANITKLRGIENGYVIVRAARNGLLSVSDAYGRMLAVQRSAKLPGAALLATVNAGARVPTIYTRTGDVLGWLCAGAAIVLWAWSVVGKRRKPVATR
jgi:apolipoprotein N-acyltransferase